ncbi:MAG: bifunctional 5,10-methylenetetrahydrofolate dehydrogenase/5,10-methenyltetrahydrofolate cyclohydrolase [Pirellulales bacterium]|nr:bifunctional 5,10-methylenetetrahydrofolate dehydrogenase/5,10-methenyltetrahydrofolate cyclohydrolase [Pirellulales bacterium]
MISESVSVDRQARLLDGRPIAAALRDETADRLDRFRAETGMVPGLAIVLATADPASQVYSDRLVKTGRKLGFDCRVEAVEPATPATVHARIERLNRDDSVDGILVQMPLPAPMSVTDIATVISPQKDVDGISSVNVGRVAMGFPAFPPATPLGGFELLRRYGIPIAGQYCVVVGRSNVVGRPFASLMLGANATVTICHRRTPDLARFTRQADIVALAAGQPGLLTGDMIKPGAIVVDFGTTPTDDGLKGDADFESVARVASWLTPVPGGTGPMTNVVVLRQTLEAAFLRRGLQEE